MRQRIIFAAALALVLSESAQAQQASPGPACVAQADSRNGGVIQVAPASQVKGATQPQVLWEPIATGPGVMLMVTYGDGALAHMDEPNGVLIRFRTPGERADSLSVAVRARNGRAWRFDGSSIVTDPNNQAHVAFGLDWPYGRGVLAAIADGQPLTISIEQDGQVTASSAFGLDNVDARDTLLAQARARFQALSHGVCGPHPDAMKGAAAPGG